MKREEIVKALEICDANYDGKVCRECPYRDERWNGAWVDETGVECWQEMRKDAADLLKSDEKTGQESETHVVRCHDGCTNYDSEEDWCYKHGFTPQEGDFCSYGEK